jgi:DNA-directed RNA polymerase specialized sigma24 family protein
VPRSSRASRRDRDDLNRIARELGISINTVGTRLVRARSRLKVILNAKASVC